jgi:ADP-ribosyl-[dinitrogen reductase] hydrolase
VPESTHVIQPVEVSPGLWAADLDGARMSSTNFAVISLCRTGGRFGHELHRFAYLTDDERNPNVDGVLNDILGDIEALRRDGKQVLVHCHGGASRTGLVLRGWLVAKGCRSVDDATAHAAERWPHLGLWNDTFTAALQRLAVRNG